LAGIVVRAGSITHSDTSGGAEVVVSGDPVVVVAGAVVVVVAGAVVVVTGGASDVGVSAVVVDSPAPPWPEHATSPTRMMIIVGQADRRVGVLIVSSLVFPPRDGRADLPHLILSMCSRLTLIEIGLTR
jgi:hypothetical protein